MKLQGFTFPYGQKTVFVKTTRERKTRSLARNILNQMLIPDCPSAIDLVMYHLQKAECELKELPNGTLFYSMSGKGFGEAGPREDLILIHVI